MKKMDKYVIFAIANDFQHLEHIQIRTKTILIRYVDLMTCYNIFYYHFLVFMVVVKNADNPDLFYRFFIFNVYFEHR